MCVYERCVGVYKNVRGNSESTESQVRGLGEAGNGLKIPVMLHGYQSEVYDGMVSRIY